MPSSASPRPAPSSAWRSGTISAAGFGFPVSASFRPCPVSSAVAGSPPDTAGCPGFCPYYSVDRQTVVIIGNFDLCRGQNWTPKRVRLRRRIKFQAGPCRRSACRWPCGAGARQWRVNAPGGAQRGNPSVALAVALITLHRHHPARWAESVCSGAETSGSSLQLCPRLRRLVFCDPSPEAIEIAR